MESKTNPIFRRRQEKGLSQMAVAGMIGVTDTTVSFWENGFRMPQPRNIPKFAKALDLSPEQLLNLLEEVRKECQR